ncbi:MAG: SPOR domain-containing protein [Pseudomonadales bacterium]|nr:SPOR domain-containing protein [Pseudomonadales bacterium]
MDNHAPVYSPRRKLLPMSQDFAKQRPVQNRSVARNTRVGSATTAGGHWSWFFTGLLAGVFLTFIAYLGVVKHSSDDPAQSASAGNSQVSETGNPLKPEFQFYDYLPEAQVLVDVVPVPLTPAQARTTASAQTDINEGVNYLLQAGSFQDRNDAENRRARIILLNLQANVVPGVVSGKTWHRVQVGPFTGRNSAEAARDILSSNNIDTIVLRMR